MYVYIIGTRYFGVGEFPNQAPILQKEFEQFVVHIKNFVQLD